jgi:hypothetical protein
MRNRRGHALALAVLLIGLTGCGEDEGGNGTAAPRSATSSPTLDVATTPFADSAEPVAIEPGTYSIPRSEWSRLDFSVRFPEGWTVQYGHVYLKHPDTDDELGFYAVIPDTIYADACAGSEGELMTVGPSGEDLVAALLRQRGPIASEPVETTLGGYPATRIDLTVPERFDLTPCNLKDVGFQVWFSHPADKYFVLLPDVTMSVYIVDVDGERQVVLANGSATSDEELRELHAILQSIQIEA